MTDLPRPSGSPQRIARLKKLAWLLLLIPFFVLIGRGAILHHDFPDRIQGDEEFEMIQTPVTTEYLRAEGLSDTFVK